MDKRKILEKLNQEREYYNVEYLEKHKSNKKEFTSKIFLDFVDGLRDSDFIVNQQDNRIEFIGTNEKIKIQQITDFDKTPKKPLLFDILITKNDQSQTYQIRPFNDSPLPNPDFNRLLSNPYKGKDLLDIEIEEEQKNIDFFKRFISDKLNFDKYIYACESDDSAMIEFKSIKDMIKYLRNK